MRYTFGEVKNLLYIQARKVKNLFPNKYELDELVNEVWSRGNIQKLDNIKYVAKRSYWDMIDYIRVTEGRNFMRHGEVNNRPRQFTNQENEDGSDFFACQKSKHRNHIKHIDNKDQIDFALSHLPEQYAKILRLYYIEGLTLKEVGVEVGLSEPRVSIIRKKALKELHDGEFISTNLRMTNKQKQGDYLDARSDRHNVLCSKSNSLVDILPEYVSDYEINNEYAVEEDFILERDWNG